MKLITTREYSDKYGVTTQAVRQYKKKGQLKGRKVGKKYFVEDALPKALEKSPKQVKAKKDAMDKAKREYSKIPESKKNKKVWALVRAKYTAKDPMKVKRATEELKKIKKG